MGFWGAAGATAMLAAIGAAPAAAQAPSYGGGHLPSTAGSTTRYVPTLGVTLQPRGDRIALRFDTSLRCGGRSYDIVGRTVVAWDGRSFAASARRTMDIGGGRIDYDWALSGQADGTIAAGTVRVTGVRATGRRRMSCNHHPTRPFAARLTAPAPTGAPRPPGGASYGGVSTISVADGLPGPVTLKASRDGGKIAARWTALGPCRTGSRVALVNFTPPTAVRASGAFSRSERFKVRYVRALVRYRVYFGGRIAGESATGSLRLRARIYNRAGTRLRTTCDTGRRTWSAGLLKAITPAAGAPAPASSTTAPSQPVPARQPIPGAWSLNMTSDAGDYIGQGRTWAHGPPADQVSFPATDRHQVQFDVATRDERGQPGSWSGGFYAPPGEDLATGVTYQAIPGGNGAWFGISGMGRGCNTARSTFAFQELTYDADGTLRSFHATFEQHCEGMTPALRGTWDFKAA